MKGFSLPNNDNISRQGLFELYVTNKHSVAKISTLLGCSQNKINYWLKKHGIDKRSISDAMYHLKNPLGDPFSLKQPQTLEEAILFGMGLGLYWGEGSKRGSGGVRLTNTDPKLLIKFIEFLEIIFSVDRKKLKFSLQIFDDMSGKAALNYWLRELNVSKDQFYKIVVSKSRGPGTYKRKSEYGVVIVYFNNVKLKKIICSMIENIK